MKKIFEKNGIIITAKKDKGISPSCDGCYFRKTNKKRGDYCIQHETWPEIPDCAFGYKEGYTVTYIKQ